MKQSLIITAIICLVLGESFSLIAKKNNQRNNKNTYCCSKTCKDVNGNKTKLPVEPAPYFPMVNMFRYL